MLVTGWIRKTLTSPSCSVLVLWFVFVLNLNILSFQSCQFSPEVPHPQKGVKITLWRPPKHGDCWEFAFIYTFQSNKAHSAGWESWKNGLNHMLTSSSGEKKGLTDSCDQQQASPEKTTSSPTFLGADCWINSENNLFYQPGLSVEHLLT